MQDELVLKKREKSVYRSSIAILMAAVLMGSAGIFVSYYECFYKHKGYCTIIDLFNFIFGLVFIVAGIYSISYLRTRELKFGPDGVEDSFLMLPRPFSYRAKKVIRWDRVKFVRVLSFCGELVPATIIVGRRRGLAMLSEGFLELEKAMPLIQKYLPEEKIEVVDVIPDDKSLKEQVSSPEYITMKSSVRSRSLIIAMFFIILVYVALWLLVQCAASVSDAIGRIIEYGVPEEYCYDFWVTVVREFFGEFSVFIGMGMISLLLLGPLLIFPVAGRLIMGPIGIVGNRRYIKYIAPPSRMRLSTLAEGSIVYCPWDKVDVVYTAHTPKGEMPATILCGRTMRCAGIDKWEYSESAMQVIVKNVKKGAIRNWDFPAGTGSEKQDIPNNAHSSGKPLILRKPGRFWSVYTFMRSLTMLAAAVYVAYKAQPIYSMMRAGFISAGESEAVEMLSRGVGILFLSWLIIVVLLVVKDLMRKHLECLIDAGGLTFVAKNSFGRAINREHIPWGRIREVYSYDYRKKTIAAEIVFDGDRCMHLKRFFGKAPSINEIEKYVSAGKIKPWNLKSPPPGFFAVERIGEIIGDRRMY